MATIVTYDGGLRRIEFSATPNGPRKAVRLGRISARQAELCKARIETIIADKALNRPHDAETAKWLADLDEKLLARLRAVGLAEGVGLAATTLGTFLERYFATMTTKDSTRTFYAHTRRNLETHFGKARALRSISAEDADGWRTYLVETEQLSPATVARRIIAARTLWRRAIRWKLAGENPFAGVKAGHQANDERKVFVPRATIGAVLAECPDAEWRAIIALARYGGLRTPSETFALKWGHVDFERGAIRVPVPKLAHIEGHAFRTVPLFPELRDPLLKLFDDAEPGTEHVIVRHRDPGQNLRTQFERIIARAGVTPWPRLFHNLRASRETELMREYDLATVCKWIGNSPGVAAKHYATSIDLDADFKRATAVADPNSDPRKAQQKAQQSASAGACHAVTPSGPTSEKHRENKGNVTSGHLCASAVETGAWAILDSNQ